jgi:preprotein translocase subunit YajC
MSVWLPIFAQEANQQGGAPSLVTYIPFIIMGLMLVMFFRATSKQRKEQQNALSALKKNDKVVTSGGILGVVVAIKENEDEVTLKVDDSSNTRIRVLKSSIVRVTPSGEPTVGEKTG